MGDQVVGPVLDAGVEHSTYLPVKKQLSTALFGALRSVGAFQLASRSNHRQGRLLILCYHGLSLENEHRWLPKLYIAPEQFRQRMQLLRDSRASVLPFGEAFARLQKGTLPPRAVAITFDDGFYDFLRHGVPILSEFGFPCTLYLTTHYCDHRAPIIDLVLDYLLWRSGRTSIELPDLGRKAAWPLNGYFDRQKVVRQLLARAEQSGMSTQTKDEIACLLAEHLGIDYGEILRCRLMQALRPDEVQQAARAGVDIELHTHRHRTPRDRSLFLKELQDNRKRILELTGKNPTHFCYPSGDYTPEFFPWLNESGVRSATTCKKGMAKRASNPFELPRVLDDCDMNQIRFESIVSGVMVS